MDEFMEHLTQSLALWTSARGRSLRFLARTFDIPYSTLLRLRDKVNEPSFEVLASLLPILNQDRALQYGQRRFPGKVQSLGQMVRRNIKAGRELQELLHKSYHHFCIIRLCATIKGVSLNSIRATFGAAGEAVLDELIDKDLAYLSPNGQFHLFHKLFQASCFEMISKQVDGVQKVIPHYNPECSSAQVELRALSRKGLEKARELEKRFLEGLAKLDENPQYHGDQLYFLGMTSGLLGREAPELTIGIE